MALKFGSNYWFMSYRALKFEELWDHIDGDGEDDGGILLGADVAQSLDKNNVYILSAKDAKWLWHR